MHVISIALDPKVLDPESVVAYRARFYGELVEHYSIVVPSTTTVVVRLSDRVTVYGLGGSNKAVKLFRMYRKALALIRDGKGDVITAQDMYYLGLIGLFLAHRFHKGLEVQVLGIEKLTWLRKRLAVFVMKRASVVRALSSRLKDRLIREFGIPEALIRIVSIYVDVQKLGLDVRTLAGEEKRAFDGAIESFRSAYGKKFNFLTVSRLVPIKQIELQLQALAALVPQFPHAMLHVVGNGPHEDVLTREVERLGLSGHVVFHGYQTGHLLGLFYLECDAFLLTSDYEGWGMVIIEAATAGLPVIMTDVGCAGELIRDGESGLVVPPRDVPALTEAMRRMLAEPALRETLSTGATRALASLPTFDTLLSEYRRNWEIALAHRL